VQPRNYSLLIIIIIIILIPPPIAHAKLLFNAVRYGAASSFLYIYDHSYLLAAAAAGTTAIFDTFCDVLIVHEQFYFDHLY
jgi:hypothetical protein